MSHTPLEVRWTDTDVWSTGRETEKVLPTTWVERITCEIEWESLPFESVHS